MGRKRSSCLIDILAAAAAADNHVTDDADEERSGSGSELNKLSGSDPDSPVIPKSPNSKPSRKRSLPKHLVVDDAEQSNKNARVDKYGSSNRLWSEHDEVAILQGMIDYKLQKNKDSYSDMNAFHEFVKESISVSVSKKQLSDKIRRLKNKYLGNAAAGTGHSHKHAKTHEGKMLELANKIWDGESKKDVEDGNVVENGKDDGVENGAEVDDKEGRNVVEDGVNGKVGVAENGVEVDVDGEEGGGKDFKKMYPYLSRAWESDVSCSMLMKNFLMDNIGLVGSVELREMDKKWKSVYVEQLKLYVKKLDLVKEHAQAVLDQLATSDS